MSLWTLVLSLMSAFIGASLNNFYNRLHVTRQNRIQTTLRLFDEFNSKEMFESRQLAYNFLKRNLSSEHPLSLDEISTNIQTQDLNHVYRIFYFFDKLVLLDRYNQLEPSLAWN